LGCRRAESGWGAEDYGVGPRGCRLHLRRGGPWLRCSWAVQAGLCAKEVGSWVSAMWRTRTSAPSPFACVGDVLGHGGAVSSRRVVGDGQPCSCGFASLVGYVCVVGSARSTGSPMRRQHPAGCGVAVLVEADCPHNRLRLSVGLKPPQRYGVLPRSATGAGLPCERSLEVRQHAELGEDDRSFRVAVKT